MISILGHFGSARMPAHDRHYAAYPPRPKKKKRRGSPFAKRLAFGQLDLRSREGRFAHDIAGALVEQLGAEPTPAQQLVIQAVALKVLRVELLVRRILSEESIQANADHSCLAWMNSTRRDLEALGLLLPTDAPPADPMAALRRHIEAT